jgi:hypothetical protein
MNPETRRLIALVREQSELPAAVKTRVRGRLLAGLTTGVATTGLSGMAAAGAGTLAAPAASVATQLSSAAGIGATVGAATWSNVLWFAALGMGVGGLSSAGLLTWAELTSSSPAPTAVVSSAAQLPSETLHPRAPVWAGQTDAPPPADAERPAEPPGTKPRWVDVRRIARGEAGDPTELAEAGPPVPTPSDTDSTGDFAEVTPSAEDLSEQVRLLRDVHRMLQEGRPTEALALLDSSSPAGRSLGPERVAARSLALCSAARMTEGRAAARQFLADYPHSPMAPRVRQACHMEPDASRPVPRGLPGFAGREGGSAGDQGD